MGKGENERQLRQESVNGGGASPNRCGRDQSRHCLLPPRPGGRMVVRPSRRRGRESSSASPERRSLRPASDLSVLRVPVALEIGDQRRAEVTIGLLSRVNRGEAPKQIERLLAN